MRDTTRGVANGQGKFAHASGTARAQPCGVLTGPKPEAVHIAHAPVANK